MTDPRPTLGDHVLNAIARLLIGGARLLPYRLRVPTVGWVVSRLVAPLAGWNRRVRSNIGLVMPDLPEDTVRRIIRGSTDNAGRAVIETYSPRAFKAMVTSAPMTGPGVDTLLAACRSGRPVILASAHIGNYDAIAVALKARGIDMGVLYRPMKNPLFNAHYVAALAAFAAPPISTDRAGITQMVRMLRAGQVVALNHDVKRLGGVALNFMGHTAYTATSAAEWALKYDALLVPVYGIRQPDGLSFEVHVDMPVPHTGDPADMSQRLNDCIERQVRAHPEQWFWVHRRWQGL